MKDIIYKQIGIIKTPFDNINGMPIQPIGAKDIKGTIDIEPEYIKCLKDLEGFSHIFLIYHFHLSNGYLPEVIPFMDAPKRPNPIGLSVVRLEKIDGLTLHIKDIDVVNGTPLLDIKPYVPEIDAIEVNRIGWMEKKVERIHKLTSDTRFK